MKSNTSPTPSGVRNLVIRTRIGQVQLLDCTIGPLRRDSEVATTLVVDEPKTLGESIVPSVPTSATV